MLSLGTDIGLNLLYTTGCGTYLILYQSCSSLL